MLENGFAEGAGMVGGADGPNENVLDVSVDAAVVESSSNFSWLVKGEVNEGGVDPKSGFDSCRTDVDEEACEEVEVGNAGSHEGRGFDGSADVTGAGVADTEGPSEDKGIEENGPVGAAAEVIVDEDSDIVVVFVF